MAQIATYDEWIKRTQYDYHPRSSELKKLDKKVEYYFVNWKGSNHEKAKSECLTEFEKYVKAKWAENAAHKPMGVMGITLSNRYPRNKNGAFDDLRTTMLTNTFVVDRSLQEAQNVVLEAQAGLLDRLLYSQTGIPLQFTTKNASIKEKFKAAVSSVAVSAKGQVNGGKTFAPGQTQNNPGSSKPLEMASKVQKAKVGYYAVKEAYDVKKIAGVIQNGPSIETATQHTAAITKELTPYLGHEIAGHVGEFVGEVVPIIGHIISGVRLVKAVVDVAKVHMLKADLENISNMGYMAPGAPQAAIDSVCKLYTRIAVQKDINLGMCTAKFGAQFDPTRTATAAVGAADAARKIVELIALMIMELKEVKAANDIIVRKLYKQNFEQMFVSCPLLGAYVVVGSDTSSLINVAVKFYGTNGWQVSVEQMRKSTEKLYAASRSLIKNSKFEIQGFAKTPMPKKDIPQSAVSLGIRGGRPPMSGISYSSSSMGRARSNAITSR